MHITESHTCMHICPEMIVHTLHNSRSTSRPDRSTSNSIIADLAAACTAVFFSWVLPSNRGTRAARRGSGVLWR